jgi:hypothetical protein
MAADGTGKGGTVATDGGGLVIVDMTSTPVGLGHRLTIVL